jgi:hypothetical protein
MLWYLSFIDANGLLGATVVEATDATSALAVATETGRNPGGEAMVLPVPENEYDAPDIAVLRTRLCDENTMLQLGAKYHDRVSRELRAMLTKDAVYLANKVH